MAVLDQLNLNLGTEQNANWVLHDLHDKRISTTAVTTATHLLATNAGVTAMNPITAANLASVLGGMRFVRATNATDSWDDLNVTGYYAGNPSPGRSPFTWSHVLNFVSDIFKLQVIFENAGSRKVCYRSKWGNENWTAWYNIDNNFGCNTASELGLLLNTLNINTISSHNTVDLNHGLYIFGMAPYGYGEVSLSYDNGINDPFGVLSKINVHIEQDATDKYIFHVTNNSGGSRYYKLVVKMGA